MIDGRTAAILQLPELLQALAGQARSRPARDELLRLRPGTDPAAIRSSLEAIEEIRRIQESTEPLRGTTAPDLQAPLARAAVPGAILEALELRRLGEALEEIGRVRREILSRKEEAPLLWARVQELPLMPDLQRDLLAAIDEEGVVRDSASPELRRLRREIHRLRDQLRDRLARLVLRMRDGGLLQDDLVTLRGDRYVIPIKSGSKGRLSGVIHGESASGATLYLEPQETLEEGNDLVRAVSREEAEVRRILRELTARIGEQGPSIALAARILAEVEALLAKAAFAGVLDAASPVPAGGAERLRLLQARHPLLLLAFRTQPERTVVPIDLELVRGRSLIVISGPNTGGKTVALRTVGLLALMHQCGLPIPASPDSELPIFQDFFADIGDEQSLAESLSTFSGHIRNLNQILEGADRDSLVLMDELGTGTDPEEGVALSVAVLQELLRRNSFALATTHHGGIKAFVTSEPRAVSAAVEFDLERLSPTYRLLQGQVGRSFGFQIAGQLGFPSRLLESAREAMGAGSRRFESALEQLEQELAELRRARDRDEERIQGLKARIGEEQAAARDARQQAEEEADRARTDAEQLLQELRGRFREILHRAETRPLEADVRAKQGLREVDRQVNRLRRERPERPRLPRPEPVGSGEAPRVGDQVEVPPLGMVGEVLTVTPGKGLEVQVGAMRTTVSEEQVSGLRVLSRAEPSEPMGGIRVDLAEGGEPPPQRLHLLGYRVEDALVEVERLLDAAGRHRYPLVTIVHGVGTGALRSAIRKMLRAHPMVAAFRSGNPAEGGVGVTVAELAD